MLIIEESDDFSRRYQDVMETLFSGSSFITGKALAFSFLHAFCHDPATEVAFLFVDYVIEEPLESLAICLLL